MEFVRLVKSDLDRALRMGGRSYLMTALSCQGFWASFVYRFGQAIRKSGLPDWLLIPPKAIHFVLNKVIEAVTGISIDPSAEIGPGLCIPHFGGICIGGGVKIGSNCTISQGVTVGISMRGGKPCSPQLGDRVHLAPGSKVLGRVDIADDVMVGANTVVTISLQPRAVALGVPARIISYQGSFDHIQYFGMENDPLRRKSFKMRSFKAPKSEA